MGDKPKPTSKADYAIHKKESPSSKTSSSLVHYAQQHSVQGLRPPGIRPPLSPSGKQSYSIPTTPNPFAPLDYPELPPSKPLTYAKMAASPSAASPSSSPTISNPAQFDEPGNVNPSSYIYNKSLLPILAIEPEFKHCLSPIGDKSQNYYEFILVDTDSVVMTHVPNKDVANHSKCRILKVLSYSDWNQALHTPKRFSQEHYPPTYTYFDYIDAWYKTFSFQNSNRNHSWFFHFCHSTIPKYPAWFNQWFSWYGPDNRMLPSPVLEGFEHFFNHYLFPGQEHSPLLLIFFTLFQLPWISKWDYVISPIGSNPPTPHLCRRFSFKWWDKAVAQKAYVPNIILYLHKNPSVCKTPIQTDSSSEFLVVKSKQQAKIASTRSKAEYKQHLREALSQVDSDEEHSDETSSHPFYQNEDDCYSIEFFSQM
ncbi:hypothetical protein L1049_027233 [Liquidambar formosana]|uniref:Uncharacterized protein n=1 Tax=Liquidambar formosana TaxID=63359 RepID=A0AAP0N401_LIQFO